MRLTKIVHEVKEKPNSGALSLANEVNTQNLFRGSSQSTKVKPMNKKVSLLRENALKS
jgi:hypothetical protein